MRDQVAHAEAELDRTRVALYNAEVEVGRLLGEAARVGAELAQSRTDLHQIRADVAMLARLAHRLFEARDWSGYGPPTRRLVERYLPA